jgi:protoporphyrinogen oxidase
MNRMSDCHGFVVLGSGMAGLGASHYLSEQGVTPYLYEARPTPGGHTSTHFYGDGFTFDEGPHISFTSDPRIQALFEHAVGGEFERLKAYVNNYWKGHWIKHPAQVNLHGLPEDLIVRCITDMVDARGRQTQEIKNYADWLDANFGVTFARTFPAEYSKKYHTTAAENLTTDWLGPRLYQPKLEEVLIGALKSEPLDVHYVDHFRYPTKGGFAAYLGPLLAKARVCCSHRVVAIDAKKKRLTFENGSAVEYDGVISSIPLPRLVEMIEGAPQDVRTAASRLSCSQLVLVNIGINRPVETKAQWTYFYDEDICFSRLSFPASFSTSMVPPGCGSIQAEVYFSEKWKPLECSPGDWIEPTIDGLIQCGLVRSRDEIIHRSTIYAPFANVIFDHDRTASLAIVHAYLDDIGIRYCGRYGDWGYIWTDQAFMSGERAARAAMGRVD